VLGGDPLVSDCVGGNADLVIDAHGILYVSSGTHIQRYRRTDDAECRLEPLGARLEPPPVKVRSQRIDGPLYMRSGGPAWSLLRAGAAIYAHDFLGGLFRIDRGKPEPSCVDVFGYATAVSVGNQILVSRQGIERLVLGKRCRSVSAKIDDKTRGHLYTIGDRLYQASGPTLMRYDGKEAVAVAGGTRICSIVGVSACGDGACIVDNNCMQVVQLDADGKVLRVIESDQLFAARPYGLQSAASTASGSVLVLARHRDVADSKQICEAAIYELPAALFAL
jgi:hypothetical protein